MREIEQRGKWRDGENVQLEKFYSGENPTMREILPCGSCTHKILKIEMTFLVYFGMSYILFDY